MLDFYDNNQSTKSHLPLISKDELSDQEVLHELDRIKLELKDEVVVLGHHYQQDDIIKYADHIGDSLALAKNLILFFAAFILWPKQQIFYLKVIKVSFFQTPMQDALWQIWQN